MTQLDPLGRCCGRKPIFYRGGSWMSPPGSPKHYCPRCDSEYGTDGKRRANWAWAVCVGCGCWIRDGNKLCGECACEDDCAL